MATVPERILGDRNPLRRAMYIIIALCLLNLFLVGASFSLRLDLQETRNEVREARIREQERERAADVNSTSRCFQGIEDAPGLVSLIDFLDTNARVRIETTREALRQDPNPGLNDARRRTLLRDRNARDFLRRLRKRTLSQVQPLQKCYEEAARLGLDVEKDLGFERERLSRSMDMLRERT